jgi:hypothetical protein
MDAVHISEILVYFFQTTQCLIPEDCHFHSHHHEDLKSQSNDEVNLPVNKPITGPTGQATTYLHKQQYSYASV